MSRLLSLKRPRPPSPREDQSELHRHTRPLPSPKQVDSIDPSDGNGNDKVTTSVKRAKIAAAVVKAATPPTNPKPFNEWVSPKQRDEMVAALLTISTALGLASETLHICVDLLDRFLALEQLPPSRLEVLGVSCLWIAVKFYETPLTIESRAIKSILKKRRHSGNWSWHEILEMEMKILQRLRFRIMSPTILDLVQRRLASTSSSSKFSRENVQLATYFADLLLLHHAANCYSKQLLVDAIWFVLLQSPRVPTVDSPLLGPVLLLFLAHKDNIDANSQVYKSWFALRCKHGRFLVWPWQVPVDWNCSCRICHNVQNGEFVAPLEGQVHADDDSPCSARRLMTATSTADVTATPTNTSSSEGEEEEEEDEDDYGEDEGCVEDTTPLQSQTISLPVGVPSK